MPIRFAVAAISLMTVSGVTAQNLDELVSSSATIAVIHILSGDVVQDEVRGCTNAYEAVVSKAFKGPSASERITFRTSESLLMGWFYLVFINRNHLLAGNESDAREDMAGMSDECPPSKITASIATFGFDLEYSAIFEMRLQIQSGQEEFPAFYAGPPPMLQLFDFGIENQTISNKRPFLSTIEALINAAQFEQKITELLNK